MISLTLKCLQYFNSNIITTVLIIHTVFISRKSYKSLDKFHLKNKAVNNRYEDYLPSWLSLIKTQVANDLNGITQLNHLPTNSDIVVHRLSWTITTIVFNICVCHTLCNIAIFNMAPSINVLWERIYMKQKSYQWHRSGSRSTLDIVDKTSSSINMHRQVIFRTCPFAAGMRPQNIFTCATHPCKILGGMRLLT